MITNKNITKIVAVIVALAICLCFCAMLFSDKLIAAVGGTGVNMEYETVLFDTSETISVNIIMDNDEWESMLANATSEEYYQCDVEVNGKTFYSVGIRPKGNTSLTSIASDPDTDRFSLKLEFDQYVEGQTCFGLDKLILNNNYADATNMKEALIYDMYQYLGADASLYNYAKICVNGEYWGVYLALEAVEDSFLLRNYGVKDGELYKPDSMDIEEGMGRNKDDGNLADEFAFLEVGDSLPSDFDPSQFKESLPDGINVSEFKETMPQDENSDGSKSDGESNTGDRPNMGSFNFSNIGGGFSMGSNGSNLNYTDDNLDSYSTIWDSEVTNTSKSDHKRVVKALKNIAEGTDLEKYMDVDNILKYMAVHVFSVNEDSLTGSMAHNYYLYEYDGQLNIIPWDYNLSLGGMGTSNDATSTVNDAIDGAFTGTKFFDKLMENDEYKAQYHAYLQQLVDEYINGNGFEDFYTRTRNQIDNLVETDPTAFYTYDEYCAAAEMLSEVVKLRGESIDGQLDGNIPSTANGQRNSDSLVDASHLNLSVMGNMNIGGGFGFSSRSQNNPNRSDEETGDEIENVTGQANDGVDTPTFGESSSNVPDGAQSGEITPGGFNPSRLGNQPPSEFSGNFPEGFDSSQFSRQIPRDFTSPTENRGNNDESTNGEANTPKFQGQSIDQSSRGFKNNGVSSTFQMKNLASYTVSFVVLIAALIFVKLYHRRPRKWRI